MSLDVEEFLGHFGTMLDVRSPVEYGRGHIPGAVNVPLFSNEERTLVGTAYKRKGRICAVQLGWDIVTPKITELIDQIEAACDGMAKVHCWRGGIRSSAFAELVRATGIEAVTLSGGYRSFRRWCHSIFQRPANYKVLGGLTGTGKTRILHELKTIGEQVLDLEALANHRGSAFGNIGMSKQPTTEQFHNSIARVLSSYDPQKPIWIEDESRQIGSCHVPENLYLKMRSSPLYVIERPLERRLEILKSSYGVEKSERFINSVEKIRKKLGGEKTQLVIGLIKQGRLREACEKVLKYYDSAYTFDVSRRNQKIIKVNLDILSDDESAKALLPL